MALCLSGCLSPMALDRAVIAYDQTANDILSKQILLNIARAHQHQPLHFTGISNIAATFNFQFNAGATPALTGDNGALMTPIFGGTLSENPTISIIPIEGEEFTRRLLTPFQESKLTMLLRQGTDIDLVLRLLAGELRLTNHGHGFIYKNQPHLSAAYRYFRQAALHLSSIQDNNQLYAEPITFNEQFTLPIAGLTLEQVASLHKDYDALIVSPDRQQLTLVKKRTGRIILTNYDPDSLSNEERMRLYREANERADHDVMVDIRAGYRGGEWPIHGVFRLRSFHNVLNFVGQAIANEPEYPIEKNPNTPFVSENPASTLGLAVSTEKPDKADIFIECNGQYYSLQSEAGYQWNREGFRLLAQIFQMTISELNREAAPSITISK
jgi:hypothetical protein